MVYNSFADYSKKAAHWAIDNTFPSSPTIATITGGVTWYSYQVGMTYSQPILTSFIINSTIEATKTVTQTAISSWAAKPLEIAAKPLGYALAPLIVPWLAPIVSGHFSFAASCFTSFTLNMIAKNFFGNPANENKKRELDLPKPPPNIETALSMIPITSKIEVQQPPISIPTPAIIEMPPSEALTIQEPEIVPIAIGGIEEKIPTPQETVGSIKDVVVIEIEHPHPQDIEDPVLLSDCFWKFCS